MFILTFVVGGAMLREINLLTILAGMIIGLLLFNWRMVASMLRDLKVRRLVPESTCAGNGFEVDVVVENDRSWLDAWVLALNDTVQLETDPDERTDVNLLIPHIAARTEETATYQCHLHRRGRYNFGPIRVTTRFPLGLVKSSRTISCDSSVVVYPRLGRLTANWDILAEADSVGNEKSITRRGVIDGDYYGLRDWRAGDNQRWIHWRASAKLSELKVREFEEHRSRDIAVVLDLWQPQSPTPAQRDHLETAISFAATAMVDACRRGGNQVALAIAGGENDVMVAAASKVFSGQILERLAVVESKDAPDLVKLLLALRERITAGTRLVFISTRHREILEGTGYTEIDAWLQRSVWLDVTNEDTAKFFIPEPVGEIVEETTTVKDAAM